MKTVSFIFVLLFGFISFANSSLNSLPVQDGGRVKPYDTFAREALQAVYGKQTYEGQPASEIILTWLLNPVMWEDKEIVEIRNGAIKEALKVDMGRRYFSAKELMNSDRLSTLMQDLSSRREAKEKLAPFYQGLQQLENALFTFREVAVGRMGGIFPPKEGNKWLTLSELPADVQPLFIDISKAFMSLISVRLQRADETQAQSDLTGKIELFKQKAQEANPHLYPSERKMDMEVFYHAAKPFHWAWLSYLLGAVLLALIWITGKSSFFKPAILIGVLGFLLHTYGFAIRVYLTERAPVTNMYETVVWVSWGAVLFAWIIEWFNRTKLTLFAGYLVGFFCLLLSDMAPSVLDPTLQPLQPVLRSNFWLTTHVLIITVSYSAFFLAFVLGDVGLYYFLKGQERYAEKIKAITVGIYRSVQIGVALLAPGIILGGVWADYSWGRFWGWDPKETWALIALLGYLAVLHARLSGWLKDFGMAASGVITFSLVIMAWYGVNYVLGAGLHSYGFGAGGLEYVTAFVVAHIFYVGAVSIVHTGRMRIKN